MSDCENRDWCPYCDECGDMGCPACQNGTVPNHDHDRFLLLEAERFKQEMAEIRASGFTPW